ncbi:hypothetical protein Q9251_02985 [Alkalihalobacillus macyae]|uniref:hypothetical protein n=1 Tax=Guptibacillus hwajinpoensis TaxID=208199 RepID=UPI00273BE624|nr:hypothetical protein [Alkalihalobacillus macyae]MDP4549840.1 hypothetical protein [Alkalihalobacillus macyae]
MENQNQNQNTNLENQNQDNQNNQNNNSNTPSVVEYSRFKNVIDEKNAFKENFTSLEQKYNQLVADIDNQKNEEKKQQGEYKELYETRNSEYEALKGNHTQIETRVGELEGIIGQLLNSKLATIPEEMHDLIPENLSIEGKLAWVDKAQQKGLFGNGANQAVGDLTNGDNKPKAITKEQFNNMTYAERNKLYTENKELYKELSRS